jgi:parvulin-like peptidyl-prolyl isomerase
MNPNFRSALFAGGLCLGLGTALFSIVSTQPMDALPESAMARVNDVLISRAEYAQALAARQAERTAALSAADRERVLTRLVDEELLLQYALDMGLVRSIPALRKLLVAAVLDANVTEADAGVIPDQALQDFLAANAHFFARPASIALSVLRSQDESLAHATAQAGRQDAATPPLHLKGVTELNVPKALLPANKLPSYLGAQLSDFAMSLKPGQISDPLHVGRDFYVIQLRERHAGSMPRLDDIRPLVRREMQRRKAEQLLQESLDQLRAQARVSQREVPATDDTEPAD